MKQQGERERGQSEGAGLDVEWWSFGSCCWFSWSQSVYL